MRHNLLPNVTQITSGNPAQVRLPLGPTYDRIQLRWGATADPGIAGMTNLKVVVDGNVIQEYADATDLDSINKYHGRDATSGGGTVANPYVSTIYFRRPEISSFIGLVETEAERVTSLRTGGIGNAWLEFTITGAGAFCTAFSDEAETAAPEPAGLITRIKRFPFNAGAGDQDCLHDIPRGDGKAALIALHFKASDVTHVNSIKDGQFTVISSMTKEAMQSFQDGDGKVPVAAFTVVDFCANGSLNGVLLLDPKRELRASIKKTAAALTPVYAEYLDRIGSGM